MSIRVKLSNAGTEAAAGAEVCLSSPTALIKGKAKQCRALNITATDSRTFSFGVRTKPGNRGSRARFNVTVEYIVAEASVGVNATMTVTQTSTSRVFGIRTRRQVQTVSQPRGLTGEEEALIKQALQRAVDGLPQLAN